MRRLHLATIRSTAKAMRLLFYAYSFQRVGLRATKIKCGKWNREKYEANSSTSKRLKEGTKIIFTKKKKDTYVSTQELHPVLPKALINNGV